MSHQNCIACFTNPKNTENVSFHKFPTDEVRRETWIKKLELDTCVISEYTRVCSKHFLPESFSSYYHFKRKQLHPNAVPLSYEEVMNYLESNSQKPTGIVDNAASRDVSRIQM
ncbi:THAP domain-containing protein 2-like [Aphis gossypii]|uniref:THAP domain-containing protein 2-like n=1 Tax=Aphis gossypii TaxID=80765 RepID=UPI00100E74B4|nr:THAP domain-containing protein 2-like [Aphis gossypii]